MSIYIVPKVQPFYSPDYIILIKGEMKSNLRFKVFSLQYQLSISQFWKFRIQQYQTILRSIRKNITRRSTYPSQFLNKKQQESVVRKLEYFDVFIASFSTNTKNISNATIYSKICTAGDKNRN